MNKHIDRRQFLRFTGTCALAALVGSSCTRIGGGESTTGIAQCPYGRVNDPYPGQCSSYVDSNGSGYCDFSEGDTTTQASPTAAQGTATSQPTAAPTAGSSGVTEATPELVVLCDRFCRYPGHCRRFKDTDGNGICNLSEGIPADQL
jgi:hypothetical protein